MRKLYSTLIDRGDTGRIFPPCWASFATAVAVLLSMPCVRGDETWKNTGTDFNTGGNWSGGAAPGPTDEAIFNTPFVFNPNLSASLTILGLNFSAVSGYTFSSSNGAALTLTNVGTSDTVATSAIRTSNTSGLNTITAPLVLGGAAASAQSFSQAAGGTLLIGGTVSNLNAITLSLQGGGIIDLTADNSATLTAPVSLGTNTTLQIGNNKALGTGTLTTSASGTTIQSDGTTNRVVTNALALGTTTSTFGSGGNLTFGATTLSGGNRAVLVNNAVTTIASLAPDATASRAFTKGGTGAFVVTGNKSNTGATEIDAGTLAVGGAFSSGNVALGGGVLALNGTFIRGLGTVGTAAVQWLAASNGGFAAYGTSATFGATANNLNVNLGGSAAALTWGTTASFLASGQTLILGSAVSDGTVTLANPLNLGGTTQTIQVDRGATATGNAVDAILSATTGAIAGTGSVIKTGAGTLSLDPTSTSYSGSLTINNGTIAATGANYFGTSGSAINLNAGTLRYDATYTGAGNALVLGAATSTVDVSGALSYTPAS